MTKLNVEMLPVHAQWILWLRYQHGWTRKVIGERLGKQRAAVGNYERGEGSVSEQVWRALAELLHVTDVQYWDGPPTRHATDTQAKLAQHREMLRAGVSDTDPERRALEAVLRCRIGRYADTPAERLAQELVVGEFPDSELQDARARDPAKLQRLQRLYAASVAKVDGSKENDGA